MPKSLRAALGAALVTLAGCGAGSPGVAVRGITATELKVGVDVIKTPTAAGQASRGDTRAFMAAAIADLNNHGGIAGRRVVPDYFAYDTDVDAFHREEPAACAHYAEDAKVFAVVAQSYGHTPEFLACLAQHQLPLFESGVAFHRQTTFDRYPLYINVGWINLDRATRALVDTAVSAGWVSKGSRIGVVDCDEPQCESASVLRDALAGHGLTLAKVVSYSRAVAGAQGPKAFAPAVLQLKAAGIDHVFFSGAPFANVFMPQAESQRFRPRYLVTSVVFPQQLAQAVPKAQLQNVVGIGWVPTADVDTAHSPPLSPAGQRCVSVMQAAGLKMPTRNALRGALVNCEALWLLKASVERAAKPLTPESVLHGVEQMARTYQAASTFATDFGPGKHNGASAARELGFDSTCACVTYTSGDIPVA